MSRTGKKARRRQVCRTNAMQCCLRFAYFPLLLPTPALSYVNIQLAVTCAPSSPAEYFCLTIAHFVYLQQREFSSGFTTRKHRLSRFLQNRECPAISRGIVSCGTKFFFPPHFEFVIGRSFIDTLARTIATFWCEADHRFLLFWFFISFYLVFMSYCFILFNINVIDQVCSKLSSQIKHFSLFIISLR